MNRAPGRVLLARSLGRTGPEGREEGQALAGRALEDHPDRAALRAPDLAELAEIAHDGGADIRTCRRGDDAVWALRETEAPPCEWLGAAVARRCHGVWAEDAPLWLGRLAKVADDQPADLARFVVERVDALLHFRLLAGRAVFGPIEALDAERTLSSRARERLLARHGLSAPSEAAGAAARAGLSLSYAGSVTGEAVEPAVRWQLHLAAIEATFGRDLAVRMRASELAQGAHFGPDGVGERETLVHIETLDAERAAFIEWAAWRGRASGHCRGSSAAGTRPAPPHGSGRFSTSSIATTTRSGRPCGPRAGTRHALAGSPASYPALLTPGNGSLQRPVAHLGPVGDGTDGSPDTGRLQLPGSARHHAATDMGDAAGSRRPVRARPSLRAFSIPPCPAPPARPAGIRPLRGRTPIYMEERPMESATVHVLTALYALAHRLALAPEDAAEVERHAGALSPELWRETKGLLREADHHGAGTSLDVGFTPLILRWLDVRRRGRLC